MQVLGIAKLSTVLAQQQAKQEIGTRVSKMAIDTSKEINEQMVDMLEEFSDELHKTVATHRGNHVDLWG